MKAITMLVLVSFWFGVSESSETKTGLTNPFVTSVGLACGHCHSCEAANNQPGHDFHDNQPFSNNGVDHPCFAGLGTCGAHGVCGEGDLPEGFAASPKKDDVLDLLNRYGVQGLTLVEAKELLDRFPERVAINSDRGLLQVLGTCSPEFVIAQVPLREPARQVSGE